MIPILYEKGETAFTSNGLGRLRDCLSCVVTEERNGIYECDFEYPVDGANFSYIIPGRIIAVTHEDSDDVQPFDIVSFERDLEGVVTFHCEHISYRLNGATVYGTDINSLADALDLLTASEPTGDFSYSTDFTSSAYMGAADGVPRTVKQMLGGVEGSILDTYGGEYEFDKWQVILHSARGETKNFTVRYGLNLLKYEEELDYSGTYSSVIPYWKGSDNELVIGSAVSSGQTMFNDTEKCIPLDLSQKFSTKPSVSDLEDMATSLIATTSVLPKQTLKVDFLRLADMEEYSEFSNILECKLCDSIRVVIPEYGVDEYFKIVKTEYDVLLGRYNSVELGDLSTTLAEALGVDSSNSGSNLETVIERHALWAAGDVSVSGGAYSEGTVTVTKSGYKPLGIVGHAFTGTNRTYMNAGAKLRLINIDSGTCDVDYLIRNTTSSSAWAGVLNVEILWIKEA